MSIEITTTSLITGSSNTDGSGSAENLTVENGHEIDLAQRLDVSESDGHGNGENVLIDGNTTIDDKYGENAHNLSITNTAVWNDDGQKEISVDTADFASYLHYSSESKIIIDNFVDVNLHVSDMNVEGIVTYEIDGAKRGTIDVSDSDDLNIVEINAQSNNDHWGNEFEIIGSDSRDQITLSTSENGGTEYTEFSVDLGGDDDSFSYNLEAAKSDSQTRYVDGGEGIDTISIYNAEGGTPGFDFVNFEMITTGHYDITLTEEVLQNNGTEESPLIVKCSGELDFDGDVENITVTDSDYSDYTQQDFYEVTVDYADASYTVIINNVDDAWLA